MLKYQPKTKNALFKKKVFQKAGLVSSFIYQIGETDTLRKPSEDVPVSNITTMEFKKKIKYLKNCLLKYRKITGLGRGMSAVQVGIPEKIAVIYLPNELRVIINPKITRQSEEKLLYPEMCMSANPIVAPVIRSSWIEFEYLDEIGNKIYWDTKDKTDNDKMLNRVFQHEIDHLNGIINIDLCNSKDLILESDPDFYKKAKFKKV